jgi:hypothetical protein
MAGCPTNMLRAGWRRTSGACLRKNGLTRGSSSKDKSVKTVTLSRVRDNILQMVSPRLPARLSNQGESQVSWIDQLNHE